MCSGGTLIALLFTAAGVYFLCSVTMLTSLQRITPFHGSKPCFDVTSKSDAQVHRRQCKHWLIVHGHQQRPTGQYVPNGKDEWCIAGPAVAGEDAEQSGYLGCHRGATMSPYKYALENGAQFILTIDPAIDASFYHGITSNSDGITSDLRVAIENETVGPVVLNSIDDMFNATTSALMYTLYEKPARTPIQLHYSTSDSLRPPVAIGSQVYVPLEHGRAIFGYDAFWAMLPVSNQWWKTVWVYKLMQLIDHHLAIVPLQNLKLPRDQEEIQFKEIDQSNIDLFRYWQCPLSFKFVHCAKSLTREMVNLGFWKDQDAEISQAWIDYLSRSGYQFPMRRESRNRSTDRSVNIVNESGSLEKKEKSIQRLAQFCSDFGLSVPEFPTFRRFHHLDNVVLVIIFNYPHPSNIPLLLSIHEPWFSRVIFCSTFHENNIGDRRHPFSHGHWSLRNISYINVSREEISGGVFSYICLAHVMSMNLINVQGYLVIGDDVLLNFWTTFDASRPVAHFGSCENLIEAPSLWWFSQYGEDAVKKVRAMLYNERNYIRLSNQAKRMMKKFLLTASWCASDIYYIPSNRQEDYRILAELFFRAGAFLEIAVPKIMAALGLDEQYGLIGAEGAEESIQRESDIRGKYLWKNRNRARQFHFFNASDHFIHPFKLSRLNETKWRGLFCTHYVASLVTAVLK